MINVHWILILIQYFLILKHILLMVYRDQKGIDKQGNPVYGEFNNIYEQEIESYLSDNQLTPFEEEALKFSISICSSIFSAFIIASNK